MKEGRSLAVRPVFALGAISAILMLAAPGCMVGPNFKPPQPQMPAGWAGVASQSAPSASQPSVAIPQPATDLSVWWQNFHDPELVSLVQRAIQANLDLQLAQARLRQSRAQVGVDAGGLFPSANLTGSYQLGGIAAVRAQNQFKAGFDAAWELDVFGGIRRTVEADTAHVGAAVQNIRDTQVSITAEIATDYFQLRGFQQEIAIARSNLTAMRHTADITRQRLAAGFVSALDVANADAQVFATQSQIPPLETACRQTIYAISVLLGQPPADLLAELSPTGSLPPIPPEIPVGLPSELLRRRPDIRSAEYALHAATAEIGVATADLFPKFSLTGDMNWSATSLEHWFTPRSLTWGFGPSVAWNIFQGGATISNINVQKALRDQSFVVYQQTVLTALQDVENALIAFANEQEHGKSLSDTVDSYQKAFNISVQLYTEGNTDFLNVLTAQRSLYVSQDALVQSQQAVVNDLVALYKALGGGWEETPAANSAATQPAAAAPCPASQPAAAK